jgi:hypothetical protein
MIAANDERKIAEEKSHMQFPRRFTRNLGKIPPSFGVVRHDEFPASLNG